MPTAEERFKRHIKGRTWRLMKAKLTNGELRLPTPQEQLKEFDDWNCPECGYSYPADCVSCNPEAINK